MENGQILNKAVKMMEQETKNFEAKKKQLDGMIGNLKKMVASQNPNLLNGIEEMTKLANAGKFEEMNALRDKLISNANTK